MSEPKRFKFNRRFTLQGCGCAAKFGARGFHHRAPHRTSFLPDCQGQPQKKNRFRGSFLWRARTKKIFYLLFYSDSNYLLHIYYSIIRKKSQALFIIRSHVFPIQL